MDGFNPLSSLAFEENISEQWKRWKQEIDFYLVAHRRKKRMIKSSILLTCIGPQGREIYNTFSFRTADPKNFELIIQKFDKYSSPRKSITLIRYKFLTYKQKEGQTFNEFVTQLRKLSTDCEFGDLRESLIRDIVVIGVLDEKGRERMLRESELTLKKAIEIGHSSEQTKQHTEILRQESEVSTILRQRDTNYQHKRDVRQQSYSGNLSQAKGGKTKKKERDFVQLATSNGGIQ